MFSWYLSLNENKALVPGGVESTHVYIPTNLFLNMIWPGTNFISGVEYACHTHPVADPRISRREGVDLVGAPTPEAVTFWKFCMSKRKKSGPLGGVPGARPQDPPMIHSYQPFPQYDMIWYDQAPTLSVEWSMHTIPPSWMGYPEYGWVSFPTFSKLHLHLCRHII